MEPKKYVLDREPLNDERGTVYLNINGKDTVLETINELKIDEVRQTVKEIMSIGVQHDKISGTCTINKEENPDFYQYITNETERLERERQSFVREDKFAADNITVYLLRGFNDRERIGGEYYCKFDALSAIKEHALKRGELGIYGLFRDEEMTHCIKSDGKTFEISVMNFGRRQTSNDMALN